MVENINGISYTKPQVVLLQESGIGVSESAARTCYDSFDKSENESIKHIQNQLPTQDICNAINSIEESNLLDDLAWTYFHHSILEHTNLSYLIRGTSRGVLQEHARHRIQAISVRSTRYTMSSIINAFVASMGDRKFFIEKILSFDMFVTSEKEYNTIEIATMFEKLNYQKVKNEDFYALAIAKSSLPFLEQFKNDPQALFEALENGKKKRNVGDAFKHIVTDNWKVDMVVTFNLRSLKNYFTLRNSNAAYFQIRWLAQEMIKVTPAKYLNLIMKGKK
ncbi:Thymidylate synthase thyX [hydrothermal vent metagenome]|uniref:Thymidylate synthase thyX n=1 Tax=hydrothermal vent metagenome TaxID=652676 RepID=A0A1W1D5S8_9ZZZZ